MIRSHDLSFLNDVDTSSVNLDLEAVMFFHTQERAQHCADLLQSMGVPSLVGEPDAGDAHWLGSWPVLVPNEFGVRACEILSSLQLVNDEGWEEDEDEFDFDDDDEDDDEDDFDDEDDDEFDDFDDEEEDDFDDFEDEGDDF